jgi:hypothetical protein
MNLMLTFVWPALEFGGGGRVVNRVPSLKYAKRDCTHHVEVGQDSMGGGSCLVAETLNSPFSEILLSMGMMESPLGAQLFIA